MFLKRVFHFIIYFLFIANCGFSQSQIKNYKEAISCYNNARTKFEQLDSKSSVQLTEKVLIFALKSENNSLAAKTYNLLGLNFEEFSDINKAIGYYKKGISCGEKAKNDTVLGWLYNNLGGIYSYNDLDFNKSIIYFKKAYFHSKKIKDKPEYVIASLNIAANLLSLEKYAEGKKQLDEIAKIVEKNNDIDAKISLNASYADYYNEYKKDFFSAEKYYLKSINEGKKSKDAYVQLNLLAMYQDVSVFYETNNKTKEALRFLQLHNELQDKLHSDKRQEILNGQDQSIKLGEINNRIEKVEKENKNNLKKLQNNRYYFVFFGVLISLFLTLLYLLNKNYVKNIKINRKLKTTNIELHKAKQKTEEVTLLKSQFMSTVSHELRTPLYGVIGLTEIIETEHPELQKSKYVKSLQFSAKYLLTLINDILNLSKIEDDKVALILENVNLQSEIEIIVESLQVIAKQYHNKIIVNNINAPVFVQTDKTRLSQVLINLISNSLKFTKNGEINLSYYLNKNKNYLVFEVNDNGIGIPEKYLNKIFDKFTQVDRNTDEQFQGTGLGLAIVKKIISLFNGTISIESKENIGTKIQFNIPFIEGKFIEETIITPIKNLENIKILVVEDNKINQMVTKKLLQKNQLDCTIANNGFNALEIVNNQSFDVILMDIHMPGINGFETTERIKNLGIKTPIIALTAGDKHELEADITKYQMSDILIKPFEFNDLKRILEKHLI